MHPSLYHTAHRPWPVPPGPWTWRQTWRDLLFAHWPIDAGAVRPLVPAALDVQTFEGTSWIGVVPFHMTGVARRPWPGWPGISAFAELNLRLYVEHRGRAGVWFLSLDAASRLAVWAARRYFHLPYFHSRMAVSIGPAGVTYRSVRPGSGTPVSFDAAYGPTSEPILASRGGLDHWLTERYCLFAQAPDGRLFRTDVHYAPWPLQRARATITRNDLLAPHGLAVSGPPALLHFSRRMDVVVWPPTRI